jgi:hypothetical protein
MPSVRPRSRGLGRYRSVRAIFYPDGLGGFIVQQKTQGDRSESALGFAPARSYANYGAAIWCRYGEYCLPVSAPLSDCGGLKGLSDEHEEFGRVELGLTVRS